MKDTAEVVASVRARLHELNDELVPGIAEDVALAMIRGAGEAFVEITGGSSAEVTRRLLQALDLEPAAVFAAMAH